MPRYRLTIAVEVQADTISEVDDDAIGDAIIILPGVVAVTSHDLAEVVSGETRTAARLAR